MNQNRGQVYSTRSANFAPSAGGDLPYKFGKLSPTRQISVYYKVFSP